MNLYIPLELTDAPLAGVLPAGGETERPIYKPRPPSGVTAFENTHMLTYISLHSVWYNNEINTLNNCYFVDYVLNVSVCGAPAIIPSVMCAGLNSATQCLQFCENYTHFFVVTKIEVIPLSYDCYHHVMQPLLFKSNTKWPELTTWFVLKRLNVSKNLWSSSLNLFSFLKIQIKDWCSRIRFHLYLNVIRRFKLPCIIPFIINIATCNN